MTTQRSASTTPRERLGWAALFAVPMGVGVAVATAQSVRLPPSHPMVVAAGVGTTLLLALLVLGATAVNQSAGGPPERD
ncbi:hypothetical protein HALDL1_13075 [Halobacterium sp. DL1]|nr:hypothetical protein HALDL1_13075 [Halobacterium sp. DL1]